MMPNTAERDVLRRLAERKRTIGDLPCQRETLALWRRLNDLDPVRPLVWINEIPWRELQAADPDALRPVCQDPFLRGVETSLRCELYQWEHFPGDMVVEPVYHLTLVGGPKSSYADYGIEERTRSSATAEDVVYLPVIRTLADADRIRKPRVWVDWEETARRESLHHKVALLRSIPNLRKISISPKADLARAVSAIGRDYVLSLKPNPAQLATDRFDADVVRADLQAAVATARGCALEIILKDITTVRGDAARLDRWEQAAMAVALDGAPARGPLPARGSR